MIYKYGFVFEDHARIQNVRGGEGRGYPCLSRRVRVIFLFYITFYITFISYLSYITSMLFQTVTDLDLRSYHIHVCYLYLKQWHTIWCNFKIGGQWGSQSRSWVFRETPRESWPLSCTTCSQKKWVAVTTTIWYRCIF